MATTEERLTRLEGEYRHLSTKADLAAVEGALKADIAQLETRLIKWMIGLMVGSAALASSIAIVVLGLFR